MQLLSITMVKIEDLHIGDIIITTDNSKCKVLQLSSISYINHMTKIKKLDPIDKMQYKYVQNDVRDIFSVYSPITVLDIEKNTLIGIDVCDIRNIEKNYIDKKNIFNRIKKIFS